MLHDQDVSCLQSMAFNVPAVAPSAAPIVANAPAVAYAYPTAETARPTGVPWDGCRVPPDIAACLAHSVLSHLARNRTVG